MAAEHFPLLRRFSALSSLQPVELCELPTPVEKFADSDLLFIKRDDLTRSDQGGNKPRKLEFVLADIRRRQANRVITMGATGTNAGVATALMCQRENLHCEVITFPQPETDIVRLNQRIMRNAGATLTARGSLFSAALNWYLHPRRLDRKSYFLYAGCSAPVATFAYVNAMLELDQQIRNGELPAPKHIVVAAGSGATVAGIIAGAALVLPQVTVHAIQVAPAKVGSFTACHPDVVSGMVDQVWRSLRNADSTLPAKCNAQWLWHEEYFGEGYGVATPDSRHAISSGGKNGLELESTYSGKAFAAALTLTRQHRQAVLFWQTFARGNEL
ncbi:1-aminocyclopropane-1-carboxylate deaminase/D-cysteine desulfhydrase [Alcanivorax sp. 1008]|uniref:1-aminocyclopropane-1-carboxylate deaminase/D-cysteine desulfhydrase n=1 Tax=Alcanivorax sp. 1008 TaxID=2816853 RepID=UPI001D94B741|nr:pyridoxal-phosphate dependent enzyme [Alcanivorax sp. 1008]MCC1495902.1 pyridoxal-phosphate dependent enzyme [Alcanivorax sp. 1008]